MRELTKEEIEFVSGGDSDIQQAGKQEDFGSLMYRVEQLWEAESRYGY